MAHAAGAGAAEPLFDLQRVADGVYAALARPRTPINSNAAVVVYDEGVLVVDTHSRPSSASALIEQIESLTEKPVRYAVDTHFHWDHTQGNQAYPVAFPRQVAIVASEATRELLRTEGLVRVKQQLDRAPTDIEDRRQPALRGADGRLRQLRRVDRVQRREGVRGSRSRAVSLAVVHGPPWTTAGSGRAPSRPRGAEQEKVESGPSWGDESQGVFGTAIDEEAWKALVRAALTGNASVARG
jgi:glyoxylase-like metal-dependent hydrolase (beta-lactamase superfamily II)